MIASKTYLTYLTYMLMSVQVPTPEHVWFEVPRGSADREAF